MISAIPNEMNSDNHQCDCGQSHTFKFHLNTDSGNWLCRTCAEDIVDIEKKRKQAGYERLQAEVEFFSNPENMFAYFMLRKR